MTSRSRQTNHRSQLILALCFCLSCCATTSAQTSTKAIIQRLTLVKYPLELSFELKGEPLKFKEEVNRFEGERSLEFEADKDRLSKLTVNIRNVSGKASPEVSLTVKWWIKP